MLHSRETDHVFKMHLVIGDKLQVINFLDYVDAQESNITCRFNIANKNLNCKEALQTCYFCCLPCDDRKI